MKNMPLAWFSFTVDGEVPNTKNMAQMDHVLVLGEWGAAEDKKHAHMGVFFNFSRWRDGWEGRGADEPKHKNHESVLQFLCSG